MFSDEFERGIGLLSCFMSYCKQMSFSQLFSSTFFWWCYPTISSPAPSSPPALSLSQNQGLFQWVSCSHQMAKVLELQLQHQSFQWIFRTDFLWDWLVGSPCSTSVSQGFSPTPQFKSISSWALSLLSGPTLTSIHAHWKDHSLDYMHLRWQSAFQHTV